MASDSDMFQKRVSWGWGTTYKMACDGASALELAPSLKKNLLNMLRDELRSPALGPMMRHVAGLFAQEQLGFFREDQMWSGSILREGLGAIERKFGDYPASLLIRDACLGVGYELLSAQSSPSEEHIARQCCQRYLEKIFGRYGFDPMECNIMKERHITFEQMEQLREESLAIVSEDAVQILLSIAKSQNGAPPRKIHINEKLVENTVVGLSETLPTLP
jgi:hypothetical protein